jgi:hypothetical protein
MSFPFPVVSVQLKKKTNNKQGRKSGAENSKFFFSLRAEN